MTARPYTEVGCDAPRCSNAYSDAGRALDVRNVAKDAGWLVSVGGKDFCPQHRSGVSADV